MIMYRKIILSSQPILYSQHNTEWLVAKRQVLKLEVEELRIGKQLIPFKQITTPFFYEYKNFGFFEWFSIFGFNFEGNYYQIGISAKEKKVLKTAFPQAESERVSPTLKDYLLLFLVLATVVLLVYLIIFRLVL